MVAVGDKLPEVDDTVLDQTNGSGPGVGVAVLVLEIDLLGTQAHKRDVHLILAHSDHEDLTAELYTPDGGGDAAFYACTLDRQVRSQGVRTSSLTVVHRVDDPLGCLLGCEALLDLVRANLRRQRLGELQSPLVDIGDNDRSRARSASAEQTNQTNGTGTSDQQRVTQAKSTALDRSQGNTERFQKRTVLIAHISNLVTPDGGVVDIATQQTVDRRGRQEGNVLATVITARQAGFAGIADDVGFDGNTVAGLEMGDIGGDCDNLTGRFVAQDMVAGDDHRTDTAIVPEMNIRPELKSVLLTTERDED